MFNSGKSRNELCYPKYCKGNKTASTKKCVHSDPKKIRITLA
jgi:hypothetical protein